MVFKVASLLAFLAAGAVAHASPNSYAEGQVWEYRTRAADAGSLLKIQKIDTDPRRVEHRVIYHISIINVRLNDPAVPRDISHVPVSREALDDSVIREIPGRPHFPNASEGIAAWRQAKGGVFTVPIARIVDIVEQTMRNTPAAQQ